MWVKWAFARIHEWLTLMISWTSSLKMFFSGALYKVVRSRANNYSLSIACVWLSLVAIFFNNRPICTLDGRKAGWALRPWTFWPNLQVRDASFGTYQPYGIYFTPKHIPSSLMLTMSEQINWTRVRVGLMPHCMTPLPMEKTSVEDHPITNFWEDDVLLWPPYPLKALD